MPSSYGIVALNLGRTRSYARDVSGNELYLVGSYSVRTHGTTLDTRLMVDVELQYAPYE